MSSYSLQQPFVRVAMNDSHPLANEAGAASRYMTIMGDWCVPNYRGLGQVAEIHMDGGSGDYPSAMHARCKPAMASDVAAILAGVAA